MKETFISGFKKEAQIYFPHSVTCTYKCPEKPHKVYMCIYAALLTNQNEYSEVWSYEEQQKQLLAVKVVTFRTRFAHFPAAVSYV